MKRKITLGRRYKCSGLSLTFTERLRPGVYFAIDEHGFPRLHTGDAQKGYRGYITPWRTQTMPDGYRMHAWGKNQHVRRMYATRAAATAALRRAGIRLS